MAQSYLDKEGLLYFLQKIRPDSTPLMDGTASTGTAKRFANQDHVHPSDTSKADKSATVSNVTWDSTNKKIKKTINGTTTDVVTLATVATSGSYNDLSDKPTIPTLKNNFGKVKVGTTTIEADTTQDTLELAAGSNITLTPDTTNDKVTIAASQRSYTTFTGKPTAKQTPAFGESFTVSQIQQDAVGQVSGIDRSITIPSTVASANENGLMSSDDKTKLNGIATGAEVNVQSDWDVTDNTSDAFIKNKPPLGSASQKNVVTSISADSVNVPTVTAVKRYVESAITGVASFQGTAPTSFAPTNYKKGYYWVVGTAGTYAGQVCEPGDMIFAVKDYGSAYSASDFDVVQTNLDITAITNAEIDTIVAS